MYPWQKIFILLIVLPFRLLSNIENFEGKIKIIKEGIYDTLQIEMCVKDNIVRIDEINVNNVVQRSYLVNLTEEKVYALSYKEKLFTEIELKAKPPLISNSEIVKSQNCMTINGEECYQWRVRNKGKNSEITYWVTKRDYSFTKSLISILSRSQTPLEILSLFPQINGYLPLLSVDRTLLRKLKESARVTEIKSQKLPEKLFVIPPDFQELLG